MASNTLTSLSKTLIESIEAVHSSLPEGELLNPPENGISLLDTKNDLFLSYLQNLVFLIVLKLRKGLTSLNAREGDASQTADRILQDQVVKKLIELRTYLEKGVKPLEGKLRYQIDKVLRAAEDAERKVPSRDPNKAQKTKKPKSNGTIAKEAASASDDSGADDSDDVDPLAYRPNPAAFVRPENSSISRGSKSTDQPPGIYRPPRIAATSMPDARPSREERAAARPQKSATLDEFIASELSTAPMAEPSIGTTIRQGGRRTTSTRERQETREREAYEEAHYVRLPKESKAERRKKGAGRAREAGWGGEDWRDLGRGAERVVGALGKSRSAGDGSRVREALQRSRKRDRDSRDVGYGGAKMGEAFERQKRQLEGHGKKRKTR